MDNITIPLSKSKILLFLGFALAFCAACVWFMIEPPLTSRYSNPHLVRMVGLVGFAFFGICTFNLIKKIPEKRPGLIINNSGIIFDPSNPAAFIAWDNIESIEAISTAGQPFILIMIKDPELYIQTLQKPLQKKLAQITFSKFGSPISLSANHLKINFVELEALLKSELSKRQNNSTI